MGFIALICPFLPQGLLAYDLKFTLLYFFLFFIPILYHFFHVGRAAIDFKFYFRNAVLFIIAIAFGLSPLVFNYSYLSIGWTMFSGGHSQAKIYKLKVQENPDACILPKNIGFVIKQTKEFEKNLSYSSYRADFLDELSQSLTQRCPSLKLQTSSE